MKNNNTKTIATINVAALTRKAMEYGIDVSNCLSDEALSLKVNEFENNIMKTIGLMATGESFSDEDVKELRIEQVKARKIIKGMGKDFEYALNLYAENTSNYDLINADVNSFDYELVKEIREAYNNKISWKKPPKRENWECKQVYINNIDNQNLFDSADMVDIKEFENKRAAAASGKVIKVPITITRAKKVAEAMGDRDLIVVKMVPGDGATFADPFLGMTLSNTMKGEEIERIMEEKRRAIIENGITDKATGKHYMVAVRSAAQSRNGSFWFCEGNSFEEIDEFRRECCYLSKEEWDKAFGDVVYMSKMEARIGLSVSSVLDMSEVSKACRQENFIEVINSFNVKVIDDVYNEITLKTVEPMFNAQGQFEGQMTLPTEKKIKNNTSDGCGLISVEAIIKCNYALNLISDKDYNRALDLFNKYGRSLTTFKNLEPADPDSKEYKDWSWFESFILRLSKVLQFRHAGDKGILVIADLEYYGIHEDILIHDSVRKYDFGNWADAKFEICNYDKKKSGKANMNFQFWNALNISNENMKSIVDESLEYVSHKVLEDPIEAMKFLGMISKIGDDNEEDKGTIIKLNQVLKTDPKMIKDKQVQKWLSTKVSKFLDDLSIGRIPIDGAYYFIVTDPRYLIAGYLKRTDMDYLKSGENYLNGYDGYVGGFRAPLIHKSEARKLMCVPVDELWFYTDIMILNPFDGTAPAMGGASL